MSCHPDAYRFGAPDYHGDEWDPAWQATQEVGTVMVFHFGGFPNFMPRSPFDVIPHVMPFQTAIFASELLWSPIIRKFPELKMALAEGGIGWVPYFMEQMTSSTPTIAVGPGRTSTAFINDVTNQRAGR